MITDPTMGSLTDAVVAAAPALDDAQRQIALATYREVATGRPAAVGSIARRAGVDAETVRGELGRWGGVFRDGDGSIVGFWGLAIPPMPHRVRVAGIDLHAWCAWDPLFLTHILGALEVETDDPVTGERIVYRTDGAGAVTAASHPSTVVSFLVPDGEWGDDVLTTFCHHVLHFTDRSSGERWVRERPGSMLLTLDEASELGQRYVVRVFGVERA